MAFTPVQMARDAEIRIAYSAGDYWNYFWMGFKPTGEDYVPPGPQQPGTVPNASTTIAGKVRLANLIESAQGLDETIAITPVGLKAIIEALEIGDHHHDESYADLLHTHGAAQITGLQEFVEQFAGSGGPSNFAVVKHGDDPNVARPAVDMVIWLGTIQPENADVDYDLWVGPGGTTGGDGSSSKLAVVEHGSNPNVPRPDAATVIWLGTVEPVYGNKDYDLWLGPGGGAGVGDGVSPDHTHTISQITGLQAALDAKSEAVEPFVVFPGIPVNGEHADVPFALDGGSDAGHGDLYRNEGGVWVNTGHNFRGQPGTDGGPGNDGRTILPIYWHIEDEVQPASNGLGMPAPFDLQVARKVIVRLLEAPTTTPIVFDIKARVGAVVTSIFSGGPRTIAVGQRALTISGSDLTAAVYGDEADFLLEILDAGDPGTGGSSAPPTVPLGAGNVVIKDSGSSTAAWSMPIDDPANAAPGDYVEHHMNHTKAITSLPPGWSLVDVEEDVEAADGTTTMWKTTLRKPAGSTPATNQTVGFASGGAYASVTFIVRGSRGPTGTLVSTGYGSAGDPDQPIPALTTSAPNELGIYAMATRQTSGVSTGIDTETLIDQGATLIGATKTATTGVNMAIAVAYEAHPSPGTESENLVAVVAGTGSNARFVGTAHSYLPAPEGTTAGREMMVYLLCEEDVS